MTRDVVAYSFKRRFAEPILTGVKRQTIRGERKRHARPGESLQLYIGMRTRGCRLIGTARCLFVSPICIDFKAEYVVYKFGPGTTKVYRGGLDGFAVGDGFKDWAEMCAFWPGVEVFNGQLIHWTEFTADA
jgi:hypothetical protein